MQSTNANTKTPAISSARIPGPRKPAAVSSSTINVAPPEFEESTKVSPPAPKPLAGWGLQSLDEEEQVVAVAPPKSAAAKKGSKSTTKAKGRAPSKGKGKYLLSSPPPAEDEEGLDGEARFMSGPAAADFGGLPSSFDPLADAARAENAATPKDVVHLRVQQRNGRKTLTTVQGISAGFNHARILRDLKRDLCCSGVIVEDEDLGKIIQLQGDHRKCVAAFLVKAGMARKENVKIHGF
jgi:translation initiation factor 1